MTKLLLILGAIVFQMILVICVINIIPLTHPVAPATTLDKYTIITDNGYCAVVTRDTTGKVTESLYEGTKLAECFDWLADYFHEQSVE